MNRMGGSCSAARHQHRSVHHSTHQHSPTVRPNDADFLIYFGFQYHLITCPDFSYFLKASSDRRKRSGMDHLDTDGNSMDGSIALGERRYRLVRHSVESEVGRSLVIT